VPSVPTTALIVIDMLNTYDHEDAEPLAESARHAVPRIAELLARADRDEEMLTLYVNDNHEHWEHQRDDLVRLALEGRHPELIEPLVPAADVPFVTKGRHSIFYQTSVDHLLQVRDVGCLVLCGQVTEQCIQYSALDAYLRGYELHVPRDAVAHINEGWARAALEMMEGNMHAELTGVADGALEAVSR
jgi:nicotinamidase-related amidase